MQAGKRKLSPLDKNSKQDIQIAAGLTAAGLLSDQGIQGMSQVLQGANDPAKALAHVIFLALGKVRDKLQEKKIQIDDKIWIAGGGVLDRVLFEVMTVLIGVVGYKQAQDPTFVHNVKQDVLDLMNQDDEQSEKGPEGSPQEEQGESPEEEQQEQQQGGGDQQQAGPPPQGPPQGGGLGAPQAPQGAPQ